MRIIRSIQIPALVILCLLSWNFILTDFFQFSLNDLKNNNVNFEVFRKNKATAVIYLLSDCPASESYTLTLNKIAKKYEKYGIGMIGIFPGKYSTDDELLQFQKKYKVTFPLLKDPEMILGKYLNAKIAPGCFVIDNNSKIVYKGRIDNWLFATGKKRTNITENNLDDALKAIVDNTPVKIKETSPIGCIIENE